MDLQGEDPTRPKLPADITVSPAVKSSVLPAKAAPGPKRGKPVGLDAISGRNKLQGSITELRFEGLLVQVTIDVGGQEITSIITSDAARALGLKVGTSVYALIKATEVMVIRG